MWMRLDGTVGVENEDGNWEVGLITQAELSAHTEHHTAKPTTTRGDCVFWCCASGGVDARTMAHYYRLAVGSGGGGFLMMMVCLTLSLLLMMC